MLQRHSIQLLFITSSDEVWAVALDREPACALVVLPWATPVSYHDALAVTVEEAGAVQQQVAPVISKSDQVARFLGV